MPSKSKAQFRFMKAIENGSITAPGLSKDEADEYTKNMSKSRWSKLKERLKKKGC